PVAKFIADRHRATAVEPQQKKTARAETDVPAASSPTARGKLVDGGARQARRRRAQQARRRRARQLVDGAGSSSMARGKLVAGHARASSSTARGSPSTARGNLVDGARQ